MIKDHADNILTLPVSLLGSLPFCMARSLTLTILCRVPGILGKRDTGHYSNAFKSATNKHDELLSESYLENIFLVIH